MELKNFVEDLLKELYDKEDINIRVERKRHYLPDAVYDKEDGEIILYGNPPSFARLGLAYMLAHELAHHEHFKDFGRVGGDDEYSFVDKFLELIDRVYELCLREHD